MTSRVVAGRRVPLAGALMIERTGIEVRSAKLVLPSAFEPGTSGTVGTIIAIYIAKAVTGLRVNPEVELEGLDVGEHGERAYN